MSQDALDIYNTHRKFQVEEGSFSQVGIIDGTILCNGIFDNHYFNGVKDGTNIPAMTHQKRFLVDSIPIFTPQSSKIVIDSKEYVIMKSDLDKNGVPVLWLK